MTSKQMKKEIIVTKKMINDALEIATKVEKGKALLLIIERNANGDPIHGLYVSRQVDGVLLLIDDDHTEIENYTDVLPNRRRCYVITRNFN